MEDYYNNYITITLLKWLQNQEYISNKYDINKLSYEYHNKIVSKVINIIGYGEELNNNYHTSGSHKQNVVNAKYMAMVIIRCNTSLTDKTIAQIFNSNRSLVGYSHHTINDILFTDKEFEKKFKNYLNLLSMVYIPFDKFKNINKRL